MTDSYGKHQQNYSMIIKLMEDDKMTKNVQMTLPMLASLTYSDRKNGNNSYMLINKYVGPLPKTVTITKEANNDNNNQ